jgi:predicted dienelactone hydrolase
MSRVINWKQSSGKTSEPSSEFKKLFIKQEMFVHIPTPTDSYLDSDFVAENELAAPKRRLVPIIVSHGFCSRGMGYSTLCRELASHGMLVIAPDHLDGSCSYTINQVTEKPVFFDYPDLADTDALFLS